MSGPYDYNNQGYGQQPYQSQYPQGGYSQPQGYDQQNYNQQGYNQYPQQHQQQQGGYGAQEFGPPRRSDSYGPPQHGGFQHGQQGGQYGAYDASNPQGHAGYYGGQPPQQNNPGQNAYMQNQQYQNDMGQQQQSQYQQGGQQAIPSEHQFAKQSSDPNGPNYDPNAPPMTESDRGLLGAMGGAFGGHHFGKNAGHGFLGTVGGAILGSFAEDFVKDKKKKKHNGSNYSQSSWGGGSRW